MKSQSVTTFLLLFVFLFIFLACEKWNLQKYSFVQAETDPIALVTFEEVLLSGVIFDIEETDFDPKPEPVVEYGHLFSTDRAALEALPDRRADHSVLTSNCEPFCAQQGGSLVPDGNGMTFNTIIDIDAKNLETGIPYFYRTYVIRPHDDVLVLSAFRDDSFTVPKVKIETSFPEDSLSGNSMKIKVLGEISEARDIEILEYGHRLLDKSTGEVLDSCSKTFSPAISLPNGDATFFNELPFFEINHDYCVQAFVVYTEDNGPPVHEFDRTGETFRFEPQGGFWINTAEIRRKSDPNVGVSPNALEHAVSFVMEQGSTPFAYIGLGLNASENVNRTFWKFDPRFYIWEEETAFSFDENLSRPVSFQQGEFAYVGLGQIDNQDNLRFWRTDFKTGSSWQEMSGFDDDFASQIRSAYEDNGAELAPEFLDLLMFRIDAFSNTNPDRPVFFGGGRGNEFIREEPTEVDCAGSDCGDNENAWKDFDKDRKIDWGEWVDLNGDGVINAGIEKSRIIEVPDPNDPDETINVTQKWLVLENSTDGFDDRDVEPNGQGKYFIRVRTNNSPPQTMEVEVKHTNDLNDELHFDEEYDLNDIINRCEWNNYKEIENVKIIDADKTIELGQVAVEKAVKSDLWMLNASNHLELVHHVGTETRRYAGQVFSTNSNLYLLGGGENEGNKVFANGFEIDHNGDKQNDLDDLNINSLYGISLFLSPHIYFGGGEDFGKSVQNLNIKIFDTSNINSDLENVVGCGLPTLSRGIAFSAMGKGFVGIGRVDTTPRELTNELWMYIPESP